MQLLQPVLNAVPIQGLIYDQAKGADVVGVLVVMVAVVMVAVGVALRVGVTLRVGV